MTPEKDSFIKIKRLSNETEYFNNVFKRTEKVISVIFYILSHIDNKKDNQFHLDLLRDKALKTHEVSLRTLRLQTHEASEGLQVFKHSLVSLESTLRIAEAAGAIPAHINQLLFEQLIGVQRYISNHYVKDEGYDTGEEFQLSDAKPVRQKIGKQASLPPVVRRKSVHIPSGDISSDAYFVYSKLTDRAERIKTVLEAKPNATIKDIAGIITDVSEKTIQRELNSLIEKGQVLREGERRWSRYSVQK